MIAVALAPRAASRGEWSRSLKGESSVRGFAALTTATYANAITADSGSHVPPRKIIQFD
jgi:hypothetical protein